MAPAHELLLGIQRARNCCPVVVHSYDLFDSARPLFFSHTADADQMETRANTANIAVTTFELLPTVAPSAGRLSPEKLNNSQAE